VTHPLSVSGLEVTVRGRPLLRGIDFTVEDGGLVGLVGESGSGKTVLLRTLLGISPLPAPDVRGVVRYGPRRGSIVEVAAASLGRRGLPPSLGRGWASYVFQHPMEALDPFRTVGELLTAAVRAGEGSRGPEARRRGLHWLEAVRLPNPEALLRVHPHELSGGMAQRVTIAAALATRPRLLIADEPTTGLDWGVRRDIVDLLGELCQAEGMAMVLVAHDLSVIRHLCDRVLVLYQGVLVEDAPRDEIFHPGPGLHPYTRALQEAVARLHEGHARPSGAVPPPSTSHSAAGCPFAPSCALRAADPQLSRPCVDVLPPMRSRPGPHLVRCHGVLP
jgi:peptide/nickel transport system permease protein